METPLHIQLETLAVLLSHSAASLRRTMALPVDPPLATSNPAFRQSSRAHLDAMLRSVELSLKTSLAMEEELQDMSMILSFRRIQLLEAKASASALPSEVLMDIFEYVLASSFQDHFAPLMAPRLSLLHVCSRWRAVCLSYSKLWTFVTFSHDGQYGMLPELLPLSAGKPLRLAWLLHPEGNDENFRIRIPPDCLARVVEMRLQEQHHLRSFMIPSTGGLPNLDVLSLGKYAAYDLEEEDDTIYFPPSLAAARTVSIFGTGTVHLDLFTRLQHVSLGGMGTSHCLHSLVTLGHAQLDHLGLVNVQDTSGGEFYHPENNQEIVCSATELAIHRHFPIKLAFHLKTLISSEKLVKVTLNYLSRDDTIHLKAFDYHPKNLQSLHVIGRPTHHSSIFSIFTEVDLPAIDFPGPGLVEVIMEVESGHPEERVKEMCDDLEAWLRLRQKAGLTMLERLMLDSSQEVMEFVRRRTSLSELVRGVEVYEPAAGQVFSRSGRPVKKKA